MQAAMYNMCSIQLVDFNDLFVIAIGLSMAYIVLGNKKEQASFFRVLLRITEYVKNRALNLKTRSQQEEEAVISQIDYYIQSGLLETETQGALKLISGKAKEVIQHAHDLEKEIEQSIKRRTKTNYLGVISYDCFIYGIFVLFMGVLQNKESQDVDGLMLVINGTMALLLLHCIVAEHGDFGHLNPNYLLHSVVLLIGFGAGCGLYGKFSGGLSTTWVSILSVVVCFSSFIAYLIANILANVLLAIWAAWKIYGLKMSEKIESHKDDMARFKPELDKIDKQLRNKNLSSDISVAAENIYTDQ